MTPVSESIESTTTNAPPALAVCRSAPVAGPWRGAPTDYEDAHAYFSRLVDAGDLEESVRFAAAWLGPRGAAWWGALCVWCRLRDAPPEDAASEFAAIDAAVQWVLEPNDERRRAADEASKTAGLDTAAGTLAAAVFWSGGSVSLPGQPNVAPPAGMNAKLVAGAVRRAASAPSDVAHAAALRQSLRMAAELLADESPWPRVAGEGGR